MRRFTVAAALFVVALLSTLSVNAQLPAFVPVTDQMLQNPDPGDWLLWRRTLNGWGYSPLDQINRSNVNRLKMVWSRGMGPGIQEATPLVYRGVMYLPHPSDFIEAMNAATGELLWDYKRMWPEEVTKILRAARINRSLASYGHAISEARGDDFGFALYAQTGELSWATRVLGMQKAPSQHTSRPIIASGEVRSGRGCEATGSAHACMVTAHGA